MGHANYGYCWDSFAICFYDFKVTPLANDVTYGAEGSRNEYYSFEPDTQDMAVSLAVNDSTEPVQFSKQRTESLTETTSNTTSVSKTLSFTEGGSISYKHGYGGEIGPFKDELTISADFHTTQSSTTQDSQTTGKSNTTTDTWTVPGTMPPGTQVRTTQSTSVSEGAVAYTCPVKFRYKEAILSVCGGFKGDLPYRHVDVKYAGVARIFGESNGGDALEDVKQRYLNRQTDDCKMDFGEYTTPRESSLLHDRLYSSIGGTMTYKVKETKSEVLPYIPLFALSATEATKTGHTVYVDKDDPSRSVLQLKDAGLRGMAKNQASQKLPYLGFDESKGKWVFSDEQGVAKTGDAATQSEYATITNGKIALLSAKKAAPGPLYLTYVIDSDTYPKNPTSAAASTIRPGTGTSLTNDDLAERALIMVYVVAAKILAYTGQDQALIDEGMLESGPYQYALGVDHLNAPIEGWSEQVPTATREGTYYVWYRDAGDTNAQPDCICVTISRGADSSPAPRPSAHPTQATVPDSAWRPYGSTSSYSTGGSTSSGSGPASSSSKASRLAGSDRYATSAALSSAAFTSSDWAVVATGSSFPDALAASAIAGAHNAPAVLTEEARSPLRPRPSSRVSASPTPWWWVARRRSPMPSWPRSRPWVPPPAVSPASTVASRRSMRSVPSGRLTPPRTRSWSPPGKASRTRSR